jgi:hypothetical protein
MALTVIPAPRFGGILAELPTSSELVLFGGKTTANSYNGVIGYQGILGDSFSFNGTAWSSISQGFSGNTLTYPLPNYEAAAIYDGTGITVVGGSDGHNNLTQTAQYTAGGGWVNNAVVETVNLSPPPIYSVPTTIRGASFAYQSGVSGGTGILFGGITSYYRNYSQDSYSYKAGSPGLWTYLTPTNSPTARTYMALASSPTVAVGFGGKNFSGALSDTYTYTAGNWTLIATGQTPGISSPIGRYAANMVYHAATSSFILFGGIGPGNMGYLSDCWSFSLGSNQWTRVVGTTPPARGFAQMAYLTATTSTILFSGLNTIQVLPDTWAFSGVSWSQLG